MIDLGLKLEEIPVDLEIREYVGGSCPGEHGYYEGEYKIVPSAAEQELKTKNKLMRENMTVGKIPVYEVSNGTGITFVIGGAKSGEQENK